MPSVTKAVVVGMGFGGAICACRLSKRWPSGRVGAGARHPAVAAPQNPGARRFGDD